MRADGKIIVQKQYMKLWTGFNCLRIRVPWRVLVPTVINLLMLFGVEFNQLSFSRRTLLHIVTQL
jgi:hypothetical protein